MISLVDSPFGFLMNSPLPGGVAHFGQAVRWGSLADLEDRWQWCVVNIVPGWRAYEQTNSKDIRARMVAFGTREEEVALAS